MATQSKPNYRQDIKDSVKNTQDLLDKLRPEDLEKAGYLKIFAAPNPKAPDRKGKIQCDVVGDLDVLAIGLEALIANSEEVKEIVILSLSKAIQNG